MEIQSTVSTRSSVLLTQSFDTDAGHGNIELALIERDSNACSDISSRVRLRIMIGTKLEVKYFANVPLANEYFNKAYSINA
jgi:hypothetical protein